MMFAAVLFSFLAIGALTDRSDALATSSHIHDLVYSSCEKNGAINKAPVIEAAIFTLGKCIRKQINEHAWHEVTWSPEEKKQLKMLYLLASMCPDRAGIMRCVNNFIDVASPCVDLTSMTTFDALKKALTNIVDFICADRAFVLRQLYNVGLENCTDMSLNRLNMCLERFEKPSLTNNSKTTVACQKYDIMKQCVDDFFQKCPQRILGIYVKTILHFWYKDSHCSPGTRVESYMI